MGDPENARQRSGNGATVGPAVVRILAESPTLNEATSSLLAEIGEALGWAMGAIWEVDQTRQVLRCVDTWQAPGIDTSEFDALTRSISFAPGVGLPGRVWADGEPAWITDVAGDANFQRARAAADAGLHGAFAFPLRLAGRVLGVIEFFSGQPQEADSRLLEELVSTGSQIEIGRAHV